MPVKNRLEIYKCSVCGNIVEVLFVGGGELVCCGKPMVLQIENSVDASKEKHVPVIEINEGAGLKPARTIESIKIKIGSVPHPMEEKHYIQWVQIIAGDKSYREFLKPGMIPEAVFKLTGGSMSAREYCNLHGLWRS